MDNEINSFPSSTNELVSLSSIFGERLRTLKSGLPIPSPGWYQFDSLTAIPSIADLIKPVFEELAAAIRTHPIADIGCADADVAMLFGSFGMEVDAVDCRSTNYNKLVGAEVVSRALKLPVKIFDIDLDARFELSRSDYGLTFLLGTLYHIKNPYYLLEALAYRTRWSIVSTRIAQTIPQVSASVDTAPVAYLADGQEINNDATNYWIFSSTGLLRIVQRTRWAVRGVSRVGCLVNSNPTSPESDERMLLLLQSRVHCPDLQVRRSKGWFPPERESWCWTTGSFSIEIVLPLERQVSSFAFKFYVPEVAVANEQTVALSCSVKGEACGSLISDQPGTATLLGVLPSFALHEPILTLQFEVASREFLGDSRELGVCVELLAREISGGKELPFDVW